MTVTITITDPTADESRAVRAYLDALHGGTCEKPTEQTRPVPEPAIEPDEPTSAEDAGAPDRDSAGLPWDARIHAASKATVADGTWRKKRGVSDEEVAAVEAELRGTDGAAEAMSAPEVPQAPGGESVPTVTEVGTTGTDIPASAGDAPPPPPAAEAPSPSGTFLDVMKRVTASGLNADAAKRTELLSAVGLKSLMDLSKQPDKIAEFMAVMDAEGL